MNPPNRPTSVDPIISRLRPRSLGELLDHAFRLYRKHFLTFLAMTAVIYIPVNLLVQVLSAYLQGSALSLQDEVTTLNSAQINERIIALFLSVGVVLALALLANLILYVSQGALTAAVADSHLDRPVSFAGGYRAMWKRVRPLVGTIMLQALVAVGLFLPAVVLYFLAILSGSRDALFGLLCLAFLAIIPAMIFFVYIYIRWSLVVPAIMVEEELGARAGLRRSASLVQNYWWRTLGLVILLSLLGSIIAGGPAVVVTLLVVAIFRVLDPVLLGIVSGVVTVLITTLFVPLQLITMTLYYFDLRVRKEGFDLETAMAQRYWPQYGYPAGQPGGGWPTGGAAGQYAPQHGGGAPTMPVMTPPVLGQSGGGEPGRAYWVKDSASRVEGSGVPGQSAGPGETYDPLPTEGYDYPQPEAQEPPTQDTAGYSEPDISAPELPLARNEDLGHATSPTPDWLSPPVLGERPETGPLYGESSEEEPESPRERPVE